jgi:KDO2-lipid IV(A) lauroyltransferase
VRRESRRRPGRALARLQYLLFRTGVGLLSLLPLRVAMAVGEGVMLLVHVIDRRHRTIGLTNLGIAFPDLSIGERRRILRRSWLNLGRMAGEICHLQSLTAENVATRVTFEDPEYWQALLRKHGDSGALVLTGHFGNWELFAYAHGLYGRPVHLVYRALRNPLIDDYVERLRQAAGTVTLRKSVAGSGILRAVRQDAILVIPADQNSTRGMGVFVPFFGLAASTNGGLARLAVRTGLPVYPAFLVREGRSPRHRIVIGREIPVARTGDREVDLVENTRRFACALEEMIARHPDHWLWVHKRWRTRPAGEPRIY